MYQNKRIELKALSSKEKREINGGNPIFVGLGVASTIIGLGRALDQAAAWFGSGWNNPK